MGAFVAGMFLGGSRFAIQIRADISSLRTVLLPLFFGAVGVVSEHTHTVIVSTAIVTLLLTSFLVPAAPRIAALVLRRPRRTSEAARGGEQAPDLVIIGFGPAVLAIGERVRDLGRRVLILDLNPEAKRKAETMGLRAEIGDAQQEEVLEHAGVGAARLVAITLPARSAALTVLAQVKRCAPHAHVVVRSRYRLHEPEFQHGGAHAVIGDEDEVGRRLADHVAEKLSDPPSES